MEIKVKSMNRCELLTISGEIDSATAPELEEELVNLIEAGKRNIAINLRDVTFMSSAGLRALVSSQIKSHRRVPRGDVVLSEIPAKLLDTLELVGFHHLFKFFDRDVDAVGSF
jgi:anti-sigma B factor antagonist